jgi:hypothetical protein
MTIERPMFPPRADSVAVSFYPSRRSLLCAAAAAAIVPASTAVAAPATETPLTALGGEYEILLGRYADATEKWYAAAIGSPANRAANAEIFSIGKALETIEEEIADAPVESLPDFRMKVLAVLRIAMPGVHDNPSIEYGWNEYETQFLWDALEVTGLGDFARQIEARMQAAIECRGAVA